jgi:multimeric flavodoxin WrbA
MMTEGKKAFVLMGSPRHDGVTSKLLQCFIEQWTTHIAGPDSITVINAYKAAIKPCIHCGYCKHTQGCVYDDFKVIDSALREADLLVVASPVYGLGFPSPLKAIFDRTQQYFEAKVSLGIKKPIQKHKCGLLLTTFGSPDPQGVEIMKKQLGLVCLLVNASLKHTIMAPHTDRIPINLATIQEEIKRFLLNSKATV